MGVVYLISMTLPRIFHLQCLLKCQFIENRLDCKAKLQINLFAMIVVSIFSARPRVCIQSLAYGRGVIHSH